MTDSLETTRHRHTKRVRQLPDGEIGVTIGGTEFAMPRQEAALLAAMIDNVWAGSAEERDDDR